MQACAAVCILVQPRAAIYCRVQPCTAVCRNDSEATDIIITGGYYSHAWKIINRNRAKNFVGLQDNNKRFEDFVSRTAKFTLIFISSSMGNILLFCIFIN